MALPLYDSQPTRRPPLVTYLLVAANVVVFLLTPMASASSWYGEGIDRECDRAAFSQEYGAVPKELTTGRQQPVPERLESECAGRLEPYDKIPWTSAFTSMFLHGNAGHLLGNLIALFVIGAGVEDRLGRLRFLVSYLLFGLVAVYGFAFTYPDSLIPLVGASGAIAGVMGAYLILNPKGRIVTLVLPLVVVRLPVWVVLGSWFVLQWLLRESDNGVAYAAHIYGFLAGAAFALVARRAGRSRRAVALSSG